MSHHDNETPESLLKEIEGLISYGRSEPTIDPTLLKYLDIDTLRSIRAGLLEKVGKLSEEDKEWLMQFRSGQ